MGRAETLARLIPWFTEHEAVVFSTFALAAPGGTWSAAFLDGTTPSWWLCTHGG